MPHADEISAFIEAGEYEEVISLACNTDEEIGATTAALWASWMARSSLLAKLLKLGVNPNASDDVGRYNYVVLVKHDKQNCRITFNSGSLWVSGRACT